MNDSIFNTTSISSAADISEMIRTAYIGYVTALLYCALLGLLIYTTTLAIPQDMVYMWLSPRPFRIPNLLYAFTRYVGVFNQAFEFWLLFVQPGSTRKTIAYTLDAAVVLSYIGVQGLLITRAYSLCRGNKVVAVMLALFFGGGLISNVYEIIITSVSQNVISIPATLFANICTALTDLSVFGVCLWNVWGTWKLKRDTGIQNRDDLVSVILTQTVSRFCFVIISTTTLTILDEFNSAASNIMGGIQQSLSIILLADFTLDLRQTNFAAIQAANISLPTIQIRSVANYIHQSILVEMGDHETSVHTRAEDNDDLSMVSLRPDVLGHEREESA